MLKPPRRAHNGYRLYPPDALDRVLLVRRALAVGFTLDELARILSERDKGGSPCREVHRLATDKLSRIEEQLIALAELRDDLKQILAGWDKRLAAAPPGRQSRLLDSLTAGNKAQLPPAGKNGFERRLSKLETTKKGR